MDTKAMDNITVLKLWKNMAHYKKLKHETRRFAIQKCRQIINEMKGDSQNGSSIN